jgi:hypothetical protein
MKISSVNVSRLVVVLLGSLVAAAAFYGLANGTIFQHRAEGTSVGGQCSGDCGSCGEAETGSSTAARVGNAASSTVKTNDNATVTTNTAIKPNIFAGKIVEVKNENGTFFALSSNNKTFMREAGPASFQQEKKFTINPGDDVKITGFEVVDADKQAFIVIYSMANQSKNTSIVFRDNNGDPMWQTGSGGCSDCSGEPGECGSVKQ